MRDNFIQEQWGPINREFKPKNLTIKFNYTINELTKYIQKNDSALNLNTNLFSLSFYSDKKILQCKNFQWKYF